MFPEIISNRLASLQQDRLRYVKSVVIDFTPEGQKTGVRFANGAIRVRRRFTYEQVMAHPGSARRRRPPSRRSNRRFTLCSADARPGHDSARAPHAARALELNMPEAELEYDEQGRVSGAHFRKHDVSHQIIEEFMLAANEAVAEHLAGLDVPFLRRVHPDPDPHKLDCFADFARSLGYKMDRLRPLRPAAHPERLGRQARSLRRPLRAVAQSQAGGLQPGRRGPLRPGQRRLLPFHLADSSLSRSDRSSPARSMAAHGQAWRQHERSWWRWAIIAARWNAAPKSPSASWSS